MTTGASNPPRTAVRPRRSRARTLLPPGIAALVVLEIWLLTVVAGATSGLTVFLLLVAGAVLGFAVVKRAGRRTFENLSQALRGGGSPSKGGGNGLIMLGGLLLMLPGLISDVAGLLLLLPPVQKVVGRYTGRTVERKLREPRYGSLGDAFQQAGTYRPDGRVVQGEVIRDDEPTGAAGEPRPPLTR